MVPLLTDSVLDVGIAALLGCSKSDATTNFDGGKMKSGMGGKKLQFDMAGSGWTTVYYKP
jgi:hypothetical protein